MSWEQAAADLIERELYLDLLEVLERNGVRLTVHQDTLALGGTAVSESMSALLKSHSRQLLVVLRLAALAVNSLGNTRLHGALLSHDLPEIERQLANGARVDQANAFGVTPFTLAVEMGHEPLIERLALAGANFNSADLDGRTALHIAAEAGNLRLVKFLLANGAELNRGDFFGQTALCGAVAQNRVEVAKFLSDQGATVQDQQNYSQQELDVLQLILRCMDAFSPELKAHSLRVANIARFLAMELNFDDDEVKTVRLGGLMHDVGKVSLPDEIFDLADEEVTEEESELLGSHPEDGYNALEGSKFQTRWEFRPIVLHHHEQWDGNGYPGGLAGDEIPIGAQLVGIADFYDHLVTHREHDPAVPVDEALELLKEYCGTAFHPDLPWVLEHLKERVSFYSPGLD